jgi:hypothetical protein
MRIGCQRSLMSYFLKHYTQCIWLCLGSQAKTL